MTDEADAAADDREVLERRSAAIEAGRRKGGLAGAALAGAMSIVSEIVEGPKKEDAPIVVEASGDPDDVHRNGLSVDLGGMTVDAPALDPRDPPTDRKPPVV